MSTTDAIRPSLDEAYTLSAEQVATFRRDGLVQLPAVCSAEEVSANRAHIAAAVEQLNTETRPLEQRDTYGRAFLQVWNLWRHDQAVARFVLAQRFARIAAELMGVDAVRLYHDQALFKEPGGGYTPWHQDRFYWPLDTDHTVTMWMPLVDIEAGMEFVGGSHRMQDLRGTEISDDSEAYFQSLITERGFRVHSVGPMRAGDATFHDGWVLHRAPDNPSPRMREVMTVIYFADGTRVGATDSEPRRTDLERWMPGLQPGELAASPLNPLLYRRGDGLTAS